MKDITSEDVLTESHFQGRLSRIIMDIIPEQMSLNDVKWATSKLSKSDQQELLKLHNELNNNNLLEINRGEIMVLGLNSLITNFNLFPREICQIMMNIIAMTYRSSSELLMTLHKNNFKHGIGKLITQLFLNLIVPLREDLLKALDSVLISTSDLAGVSDPWYYADSYPDLCFYLDDAPDINLGKVNRNRKATGEPFFKFVQEKNFELMESFGYLEEINIPSKWDMSSWYIEMDRGGCFGDYLHFNIKFKDNKEKLSVVLHDTQGVICEMRQVLLLVSDLVMGINDFYQNICGQFPIYALGFTHLLNDTQIHLCDLLNETLKIKTNGAAKFSHLKNCK